MQAEVGRWRFKGPEMEGPIARWYAGIRGTDRQIEVYRRQAAELTQGLGAGACVLEVAPGPGYLAIEIARLGKFRVTGLDISRTFVEIAHENAARAGVTATFRQGDAAEMPFEDGSFDLIVCQAAFKNFGRPSSAISEMYRVLRPGGHAVIDDMSHGATHADIAEEVRGMGLGRLSSLTTTATLEMLRRRAYSRGQFERLAEGSPFKKCRITTAGIGLRVRLSKPEAALA
jgi:ubiquinone/menaquinone biosynthesis C-methylase UbiE